LTPICCKIVVVLLSSCSNATCLTRALACFFHFIHIKKQKYFTFIVVSESLKKNYKNYYINARSERAWSSYHMCRKWISQYFGQPYLIFHELINGVIFFFITNDVNSLPDFHFHSLSLSLTLSFVHICFIFFYHIHHHHHWVQANKILNIFFFVVVLFGGW
jgi:hypothetical protein